MEVRRFHTSHGATLKQAVVEGRMVVRVDNTQSGGYGVIGGGSYFDGDQLDAGVRLPTTSAEAGLARYIVAFTVPNQKAPYYISYPTYGWALREGWDRTGNLPMSPDIHMVWPGQKEGQTIPSGWNVICYEGGTFTVGSGQWVYDASVLPGVELEVEYTAGDNRGKLKKIDSGTAVAMTREVSRDIRLTFDLYH